jgi:hypothetical protein
VAEQLNVATVLLGTVTPSGNKLRITAQLINLAEGFGLWATNYDREMISHDSLSHSSWAMPACRNTWFNNLGPMSLPWGRRAASGCDFHFADGQIKSFHCKLL